jgi:hypothetical protein
LSLITRRDIQVETEAQQRTIKVGCDFARFVGDIEKMGENGFAIQREGMNIVITSTGAKGVLNGVYHFLEMLGCRWFFPGQDGEFIPKTDAIALDDLSLDVKMSPSFPKITFFQDIDAYRDYSAEGLREVQAQNDMDLIDWMGKNKMNAVMSVMISDPDEAAEELRRRGLGQEFGGHVIPRLLPR